MDRNSPSNFLNLLPLGIPTLIIADDPQLIAAAGAAYATWSVEAPVSDPSIELRLEIARASSSDVSLDIGVEGSRLRLKGRGVRAEADASTRRASAAMPLELLNDLAAFTEIADTLLLFLLARCGRTPVHASAFMLGDLAIVLAGQSGSGKSTLALAAAARNLPILSDDMVFVQQIPRFALWGFPRPIHVFPNDAPPGDHPVRVRGGKTKSAVAAGKAALKAERCALILLERGIDLDLRPLARAEALEALMHLDPGFDLLERDSRNAVEALAATGAWKLHLSDDPNRAIDLLVSRFAHH